MHGRDFRELPGEDDTAQGPGSGSRRGGMSMRIAAVAGIQQALRGEAPGASPLTLRHSAPGAV